MHDMKKLLIVCLFVLAWGLGLQAQVAITRDGSQPDSSAMLDIKSTARGVLIPRMGTAQRQAIVSPALGLMVFDSDQKTFFYYSGTGWTPIATEAAAGNSWKINTGGFDFLDSTVTTLYTDSAFVGIGTHTPFSPLSIATKDFTWGMTHTNGSVRVGTFVGEGGGWVATATNSPLYFGTAEFLNNIDPQMVLSTGGTLGINNQTPNGAYKLDVNGSIHCANNLDASAGVTAPGIVAKDSVKTFRFLGTQLTLSGSSQALNFQQATGSWTIDENSNGNLEFSYTDVTNNKPKTTVFIMTPQGALKGPGINPNSVQPAPVSGQASRTIQDQQAQIKSLTARLEALEQKISAVK